VISVLGADGRGPGAAEAPARFPAVGAHKPAGNEGCADSFSHLVFARRFHREERVQMNLITDALGCGVVWSERTGRLVLPNGRRARR